MLLVLSLRLLTRLLVEIQETRFLTMVPFQNPSFLPKKRTRRRSVNTSALNNVWGPLSSLDDIVDLQDFLGVKEKKVTFNKCRVNKVCYWRCVFPGCRNSSPPHSLISSISIFSSSCTSLRMHSFASAHLP